MSQLMCKFLSAWIKTPQIPNVTFYMKSQFLFRFFIILQYHHTQIPHKFLSHAFFTLDNRISSKS